MSGQDMTRNAVLSDDRAYRYKLERMWGSDASNVVGFIMLNPSIADGVIDDPTMTRVIKLAKFWGFDGVIVANLYAYISPNRKDLKDVEDPVGPENEKYVREIVDTCSKIVYGWGNDGTEPQWLRELVPSPYCIKMNKGGQPKHPLYISANTNMIPYVRR